jgi:alkylhydroperoxidase family enzyme
VAARRITLGHLTDAGGRGRENTENPVGMEETTGAAAMNRTNHPAAVEPRAARVSSRTSGEGAPVRPSAPPVRPRPATSSLLRHNLTAPEKRTLKRIEATRRALRAGVDDDGAAVTQAAALVRVVDLLRADRGVADHLGGDAAVRLAGRLLDPVRASVAAAAIIGDWLREVGGIERGTVTADRVKLALAVLQDALFNHEDPNAPIAAWVRDVKIEKRDGGLQLLAALRVGADEGALLQALRSTLADAGYGDVVVRATPAGAARPSSTLR